MQRPLYKKIIDFYIYSSLHIALGAALSVVLIYLIARSEINYNYVWFVFSSTIFIYCSHRIIGIRKVKKFQNQGRFAIIKKYWNHLLIYSIISAVATIYFYFQLGLTLQALMILPGIISILYVIPVFSKRKRLRDFQGIKIFLIAISWGFTIGLIPLIDLEIGTASAISLITLEKTLFILAITLPFDVRDLQVDASNQVKTLPSILGAKKSYTLAYSLMNLAIILVISLTFLGTYSFTAGILISIGYLITIISIYLSRGKEDDYYYSLLLDGTIILVAVLGIIGYQLF